jgi:hypothetical protein
LEFETTPAGERTASRGSAREIVDETHAQYGQLFVGIRLDPNAEAWNLVDDELVTRRHDRDIAS